jgi:hypothetical protein
MYEVEDEVIPDLRAEWVESRYSLSASFVDKIDALLANIETDTQVMVCYQFEGEQYDCAIHPSDFDRYSRGALVSRGLDIVCKKHGRRQEDLRRVLVKYTSIPRVSRFDRDPVV